MRTSRIYLDQPLESAYTAGEALVLPKAQAHYVGNVLRLKAQDPLVVFNGDGHEYAGRLQAVDKKQVRLALEERDTPAVESPLRVHLGLVISRGERMDYAVQKSTELGVAAITPLFSERCEVRLKGERVAKRQAHWQQVAVSACEQSGRVRIPAVHEPRPLEDWMAALDCEVRLIFDQRQAEMPRGPAPAGEMAILVGPEGGFSADEVGRAVDLGFRGLALGPRVLRTETAPVAALAVLQYLWGDFGAGG